MAEASIPRIYVADLAAYSASKLHGAWIDAIQEVEAMEEEVCAMLAASPIQERTEYAIHDGDGFEGVRVDEWRSLETAHDLVIFVIEHGRLGAALLNHLCNDIDEANSLLEDGCYLGAWDSIADYVQELAKQTTETPLHLAIYVDYRAMARDMELNGDILTIEIDSEVHIFTAIYLRAARAWRHFS